MLLYACACFLLYRSTLYRAPSQSHKVTAEQTGGRQEGMAYLSRRPKRKWLIRGGRGRFEEGCLCRLRWRGHIYMRIDENRPSCFLRDANPCTSRMACILPHDIFGLWRIFQYLRDTLRLSKFQSNVWATQIFSTGTKQTRFNENFGVPRTICAAFCRVQEYQFCDCFLPPVQNLPVQMK